jgi:chromate transporter
VSRLARGRGRAREVFGAFLFLGLTSFGGPIAHIGYFRREFVQRRRWLDDAQFAQLLALCQFLPGPASSQLGFTLGLLRGGWFGALAAFVAFTLPSAVVLFVFAALLPYLGGGVGAGVIQGLKLVALVVVAQGLLAMARQLCPDARRGTIAALSAVGVLLAGSPWTQLLVVAGAGLAGLVWCRGAPAVAVEGLSPPHGAALGRVLLLVFGLVLVGLPMLAGGGEDALAVADAFYRAGALVFGGGHVVLPLLEETVVAPGWVSQAEFLAGYGAAQAVPGPMFTLATFLGARLSGGDGGLLGAVTATTAVFAPGLLLVAGVLPLWRGLVARPAAARVVAGVNAAVVGLLGAALYDPVWTGAVGGPVDLAIALVGFTLLAAWRLSPLATVAWCVAASVVARWPG